MAYLVLLNNGSTGTRFSLDSLPLSIGRSPKCDIYLDDPSVSFSHAKIDKSDGPEGFMLTDSNSTNGTFVNSERVSKIVLKHLDSVNIGLSNFKLVDEGESELESTQEIKKSWIPGLYYLKDKN